MSAAKTLIPTGPHEVAGRERSELGQALDMLDRLTTSLVEPVEPGGEEKGRVSRHPRSAALVLVALLAGGISGAGVGVVFWGQHQASGDDAMTKLNRRLDDQDDRIDDMDREQIRMSMNIESIADKVGARVIRE